MSVLRYIMDKDARFQTFVANRLAVIHEGLKCIQGSKLFRNEKKT